MLTAIEYRRVTEDDLRQYLAAVNIGFSNWGDERRYRWIYEADLGAGKGEIIGAFSQGTLVAACGLVYRRGVFRDTEFKVAIMVSGFTAPDYRRQGIYTRIIQEVKTAAIAVESEHLMGFVTATNPSGIGMENAGATMIQAVYFTGVPLESQALISCRFYPDGLTEAIFHRFSRPIRSAYFDYDFEAFRHQFLSRIHPTYVFELGEIGLAVTEEVGDTHRLLCLGTLYGESEFRLQCVKALGQWMSERQKSLFMYATNHNEYRLGEILGLRRFSGYIPIIPLVGRMVPLTWFVEYGDKM